MLHVVAPTYRTQEAYKPFQNLSGRLAEPDFVLIAWVWRLSIVNTCQDMSRHAKTCQDSNIFFDLLLSHTVFCVGGSAHGIVNWLCKD